MPEKNNENCAIEVSTCEDINPSLDWDGMIINPVENENIIINPVENDGIESIFRIKKDDEKKEDFIFELFRDSFSTMHYGDTPIIDTFLVSTALQSCINTAGIQPTISGDMGTGKSSGVLSALHLFPPEYILKSSLSSKSLFYHNLCAGTTLFCDDTTLPADLLEIIKKCTSDFQNKQMHMTVGNDKKGKRISEIHYTSERLVFIFTSVVDSGDDQLLSRQYLIPTDDNKETENDYRKFLLNKKQHGLSDFPINASIELCRDIIRHLKKKLFRVMLPNINVQFASFASRRHMNQFYDFIQAVAIIRYMKREHTVTPGDEEGVITINATKEDFYYARLLFCINIKMQMTKQTASEAKMSKWLLKKFESIPENPTTKDKAIKESDLTNIWVEDGFSRSTFWKTLHGYKKNGEYRGGVLSKHNHIYCTKDNVKTEGGTQTCNIIHYQVKEISKLDDVYEMFVWLE